MVSTANAASERNNSAMVVSDSSHSNSVSSDERSIDSSASSSHHVESVFHVSSVSVARDLRKNHSGRLPYISNDVEFVANTIRNRDQNEVLKVARTMLYDAFIKASKVHKA